MKPIKGKRGQGTRFVGEGPSWWLGVFSLGVTIKQRSEEGGGNRVGGTDRCSAEGETGGGRSTRKREKKREPSQTAPLEFRRVRKGTLRMPGGENQIFK